ncbi:hypothetical protein GWK47_017543 [Chionoecetes opilio]|uniref:Uncharacterized protein n=1 Tax=Chionoecetes opilio TaxID=41210 RepID=A0A8J5CJR7_CHIOP|nr:hypothetical protein GWK47_017543 [Chionoecetes opilio]
MMDVQVDDASCPSPSLLRHQEGTWLILPRRKGLIRSLALGRPDSLPFRKRMFQGVLSILRACVCARVLQPLQGLQALHHLSPLGKYGPRGETRALGNGCALIVVFWEHKHPRLPETGAGLLYPGGMEATCRRG